MKQLKYYHIILIVLSVQLASSADIIRKRRELKFIDNLILAIGNVKKIIFGTKTDNSDEPYVLIGGAPSVLEAVGFCDLNTKHCEYIRCLADLFRHSKMTHNFKALTKVMMDISLRNAMLTNPAILRLACNTSQLNELQCMAFEQFLQLAEVLDSAAAHSGDEPRDKRSAKITNVRKAIEDKTIQKESMVETSSNDTHLPDYYDYDHENGTDNRSRSTTEAPFQFKNCSAILVATKPVQGKSKNALAKGKTATKNKLKSADDNETEHI